MSKVIGIDLGTTNTVAAGIQDGEPVIVPSAAGTSTTPSIVAYADGKVLTGYTAKRQAVINPTGTVTGIKRIIGRRFDEVTSERETAAYQIVEGPDGFAAVKIGETVFMPEAVTAQILTTVKRAAEKHFGQEVSEAVITIPAYFNDTQRTATRNAGAVAGLDVNMTFHEPTAACIAYGFGKKAVPETILVWDLGGGTFDVSILATGATNQVLGTSGDSHLGGNDWDDILVAWLISQIKEAGVDPTENLQSLTAIREQAEAAKIALSSAETVKIKLPFIGSRKSGRRSVPVHFTGTLTREQLEAMSAELLVRLRSPFKQALKNASLKVDGLDAVILVGGATNMPMVQRLARELCGKEPRTVSRLEEIVARGAAIQAGASARELVAPALLDITPLSLGVRRGKEGMDVIIPLGTRIPATFTKPYTTTANGQTAVDIEVWQGESPIAGNNHFLGKFTLPGIPPAPKGRTKIDVTFSIDSSGILSVSAIDAESGRKRAITVTGTSLPPETIRRMLAEAEANAEADRQRLEAEEAKEALRPLVAEAEEAATKLEGKERQDFELVLENGRKALESSNSEQVKSATGLLKTALEGTKATA